MTDLPQPPATRPDPRPFLPRWLSWTAVVLGCAAAALVACHALLLTVFQVDGASMEPALHHGQRLLVLRPLGEVARGDLLVFHNPIAPDEVLVKRVLGLPGEQLLTEGSHLYADGFELADPYLKPGTTTGALAPVRVEPDHFFLLGDNRNDSVDSRRLGSIPRRLVIGKVVWALP